MATSRSKRFSAAPVRLSSIRAVASRSSEPLKAMMPISMGEARSFGSPGAMMPATVVLPLPASRPPALALTAENVRSPPPVNVRSAQSVAPPSKPSTVCFNYPSAPPAASDPSKTFASSPVSKRVESTSAFLRCCPPGTAKNLKNPVTPDICVASLNPAGHSSTGCLAPLAGSIFSSQSLCAAQDQLAAVLTQCASAAPKPCA